MGKKQGKKRRKPTAANRDVAGKQQGGTAQNLARDTTLEIDYPAAGRCIPVNAQWEFNTNGTYGSDIAAVYVEIRAEPAPLSDDEPPEGAAPATLTNGTWDADRFAARVGSELECQSCHANAINWIKAWGQYDDQGQTRYVTVGPRAFFAHDET